MPVHFLFILCAIIISTFTCNNQQLQRKANVSQDITTDLSNEIWVIYQDAKGRYWFGSNGDGVFLLENDVLTTFSLKEIASDQIRGIQEDEDGNIYFDTPDGFCRYDGREFSRLHLSKSGRQQYEWNSNDLWFKGRGDINGAYHFDGDSLYRFVLPEYNLSEAFNREFSESRYSPYGIYSIYKDNEGGIWFGTLAAGVFHLGESSFWITESELTILADGRAPGVRSVIKDKSGDFWLGNVLYRYRMKSRDETPLSRNSERYEKLVGIGLKEIDFPYYVSAVVDDQGDLWMATYSDGIWKYDGQKIERISTSDKGENILVISIYKDRQGTLWLGTQNEGAMYFNGSSFVRFEIDQD